MTWVLACERGYAATDKPMKMNHCRSPHSQNRGEPVSVTQINVVKPGLDGYQTPENPGSWILPPSYRQIFKLSAVSETMPCRTLKTMPYQD